VIRKGLRGLEAGLRFVWLEVKDRRAGRQLRLVQDRLDRIGPRDVLLVTCLRNERARMPAFADHYRRLGVGHFLVIDNGSDDGFMDWAAAQPDVSVWHTRASYRGSNFGMLWCNDLLRRHGRGRWCVVVDPDEFLVYPHMETRGLGALTQFLEDDKRPCLHTVLLDAYSDRPLSETVLGEGADPFETCPFFDRDGYVQRESWGNSTWIQGGPRMRAHFPDRPAEAPALNKIPLIRWKRYYHYNMSMHDAYPRRLNRAHAKGEVSTTGALFHFKLVAGLRAKAEEEAARGEHYDSGREYARYRTAGAAEFFAPGISTRYAGSAQLVALGLMSPGRWF
jgi:hypothetical protein